MLSYSKTLIAFISEYFYLILQPTFQVNFIHMTDVLTIATFQNHYIIFIHTLPFLSLVRSNLGPTSYWVSHVYMSDRMWKAPEGFRANIYFENLYVMTESPSAE